MTAARKALEALEAAGSVERVEFSVVADSLADSWYARGPAHDVEGGDDVSAYETASADASRFALSVNLSAPLAAVVRAAMERPWWLSDGETLCCEGCRAMRALGAPVAHDDDNVEGQVLPCRYAEADRALDAFNSAALAQGFAAGSGE